MKMTKKFDKLNETFNVDSDIVSVNVESETVTEKIEKVATPRPIPKKENIEITFRMPSFLLGLRYLLMIRNSAAVIN